MELRCENRMKFGDLTDEVLEVRCRSSRCGHKTGEVVVIHQFDCITGELLGTQRFKDPAQRKGTVR